MYMKMQGGYAIVANVMLSAAIGLGGMGAAVSFYHSSDLFNTLDVPSQLSPPAPTPTPTLTFTPIIGTPETLPEIIPTAEADDTR